MTEILIGPICSGKSTYTRKRAQQGAVIVSDDLIVSAVHAGDYRLYDKELKPLYKSIEMNLIAMAVSLGRDVVIDRATCMRPECRRKYIGISSSLGEKVIAVVFPNQGPWVHARRRFESDSRGLDLDHWTKAAQRHESEYRPPSLDEGFDDIVPVEDILETLQ